LITDGETEPVAVAVLQKDSVAVVFSGEQDDAGPL
jgi:hypothetical protein